MTKINTNQILLGNQSAIDLLVDQTEAKIDLANNLIGKGVQNVDPNNQTLGQLVNKVTEIQSTNVRENPETVLIDLKYDCGKNEWGTFKIKNGWYFFCYRDDKNYLYYYKIDSLQEENYNERINMVDMDRVDGIYYKDGTQPFDISEDGTKLWLGNNDGTNNVVSYDITWGENYSSCTLSNKTTYSVKDPVDNTVREVNYVSVSPNGNYLLVNSDRYTILYNIQNDVCTRLHYSDDSNAAWQEFSAGQNVVPKWLGNNKMCAVFNYNGRYYIYAYNIDVSDGVCTDIWSNPKHKEMVISYSWWGTAVTTFKDNSNNYHLLIGGGWRYFNSEPILGIYHASNNNFEIFTSGNPMCAVRNNENNTRSETVSVYAKDNKYYVCCGFMNLLIFDSSWNNIGQSFIGIYDRNNSLNNKWYCDNGFLYNDDFYFIDRTYAYKYKCYFGKSGLIARTISIEGEPETILQPAIATVEQVEEGYLG